MRHRFRSDVLFLAFLTAGSLALWIQVARATRHASVVWGPVAGSPEQRV